MDKRTSDIIRQIRQVASEMGLQGKYKALTQELNRLGIKTSRGATWSPQGLSNICNRHGLFKDEEESLPVAPATQPSTPEKQDEPEEHVSTPQAAPDAPRPEIPQLDPETIAVLKEVAVWWKTKESEMSMQNVTTEPKLPDPPLRATFPGQKKNTGLRVNARLLDAALEKAKTPEEEVKTGGKLSPLIERLLWSYLGFDPKYLAKVPAGDDV